ncbi:MAG: sigma-54-dependent Fis family transcriptional regulator [Deltaproteobacteria bacterium]|nr:sigma-54-dependent Fis family transcriptional regulator [Deltaproteobacteria bacterium]
MEILLVEDEKDIAQPIARVLREDAHRVDLVDDGAKAIEQLRKARYDLVISDIRMPRLDGLSLTRWISDASPETNVILMTAYGSIPEAVGVMRDGLAFHYLQKPFELQQLLDAVQQVDQRRAVLAATERRSRPKALAAQIIGESSEVEKLRARIALMSAADVPLLIEGESGTGKELVAQAVHAQSLRAHKPFAAVNCAAFPESLFEAELFGHERGAFTGAVRRRDGRFLAAEGGTLFLDEISELSAGSQAKLLRVLQSRTIQRIGSDVDLLVDVRTIAATNADLRERVRLGRFREDLYYRLKVLELRLPPLRARKSDLPLLVGHLLGKVCSPGCPIPSLTPRAWAALEHYDYPGNVRELEHAIQHAVVLSAGESIDVSHLPEEIAGTLAPGVEQSDHGLANAVQQFERGYILHALAAEQGSRTRAAERLGISRKSLWQKMKRHGIRANDEALH